MTDNAQVQCDMIPIPSRIRGVIKAIAFEDDEYVKAGQLLATIEDDSYRLRLAQLEAELVSAKLSVSISDAQARLSEVNARGGSRVIPATVDSAEAALRATRHEKEQAQAALGGALATLTEAEANYQRVTQMHRSGMVSDAAWDSASSRLTTEQANHAGARARLEAVTQLESAAKARVEESRLRGKMTVDAQRPFIERARSETELAEARVAAAQAARDLVAKELSYANIYTSQAGVMSNRRVGQGQMVDAGQPIATLVTCPQSAWVVANFKEIQVGRMHIGQAAEVTIDTYPGVKFKGKVSSISGATGARFSLLPPENATGNFTRVVQRVPVRITLSSPPEGKPLRAGLSAIVRVNDQ